MLTSKHDFDAWLRRLTPAGPNYCDIQIDFRAFATGGGANVEDQSVWNNDPIVGTGFFSGIAPSPKFNKAYRQGAFFSATLAQWMGTILQADVLDDGNLETKIAQFWQSYLQGTLFVDTGSTNAILLANPVAPIGGLTFLAPGAGTRVDVLMAHTNTGPVTLNWMGVISFNALPITSPGGIPLSGGELVAGGIATLVLNGARTAWLLIASALSQTILGGAFTFYVNVGTGNDSNDGRSPGTAWATLNHAYNFIQSNINENGHNVGVQVAPGVYAPLIVAGPITGSRGPNSLIFVGDTSTPANCTVHASSGDAVAIQQGGVFTLAGFKLESASMTSPNGLINAAGSSFVNYEQIEFGAAVGGNHVLSTGGSTIVGIGSERLSGSCDRHYNAFAGSITPQNQACTIVGTPTCAVAFASANFAGFLAASGMTFPNGGALLGPKHNVNTLGIIFVNGAGVGYFPGSTPGTDNGGPSTNGGVFA